MGKIWIEMMIRNDEKIMDGHIDYFDLKDADNIKEGDVISITNPKTGEKEKCTVTEKMSTKHRDTGEPAIMVKFKGR